MNPISVDDDTHKANRVRKPTQAASGATVSSRRSSDLIEYNIITTGLGETW
jgi:hypothetical protein